jgi:hypothetical protein
MLQRATASVYSDSVAPGRRPSEQVVTTVSTTPGQTAYRYPCPSDWTATALAFLRADPTSAARSLLEMLVRLDVVRGPYQCEAGMVAAVVTRREGFTEDRGNFMLFGVHRAMNDFVDS